MQFRLSEREVPGLKDSRVGPRVRHARTGLRTPRRTVIQYQTSSCTRFRMRAAPVTAKVASISWLEDAATEEWAQVNKPSETLLRPGAADTGLCESDENSDSKGYCNNRTVI
jgi:hypothetical protein